MNFLRKIKSFFFPEKVVTELWPFPVATEEKKKRGRPRKVAAIKPAPKKTAIKKKAK
jgi:hypothetical protein